MNQRALQVALIGNRSIPGARLGFHSPAAELVRRLTSSGIEMTVYVPESEWTDDEEPLEGVKIETTSSIVGRGGTRTQALGACLHSCGGSFDAALVVGCSNAILAPLLHLSGIPCALLALDRPRRGFAAPLMERLAAVAPDRLITESERVREHFKTSYAIEPELIRCGVAPPARSLPVGLRGRLGIKPREYFLSIAAIESATNPQALLAAYSLVPGELPLVMVGSPRGSKEFFEALARDGDRRVLFTGPVSKDDQENLLSSALAYVHAGPDGDSSTVLADAMAHGSALCVSDTPANREVVGETGRFFDIGRPRTLAELMSRALMTPASFDALRLRAAARAKKRYDWETTVQRYEALFRQMTS